MSTTEPSALDTSAASPGDRLDPRNRSVITLLLISAFVVILNETILSVALPPIMDDLSLPETTAQWLTTAFMLTMAVVIPTTGFMIARLSIRQVFTAAMVLFLVGTAICAVSPTFAPLLLGRIVQACGTAIMMPLLMTTVMNLVPASQHGRVMGNISIVISVAPALGPTISGAILQVLPWRFLFIVVLPIAAIALVLGLRRMQNVTEPVHSRLDVLSVVLSAIGFGTLVYGLSSLGGRDGGVPLPVALGCLAVGVVALAVFVLRQRRLQEDEGALLDLRTLAHRNFAVATALMIVMMGSLFGMVVLLPIYLQDSLALPTLSVGLLLLPGGLLMGLAAPFVGRMYDRVGPRPLLVPGLATVSVGMLVLSAGVVLGLWPIVLMAHLIISAGLACVFTPLFTNALGSLPPHLYSHGSAIVGTVQQVAGAAGTALMVAIMATRSGAVMAHGASTADGITSGTALAFLISAVLAASGIVLAAFVRRNPGEAGSRPEPITE